MVGIERLDVLGDIRRPVVDHIGATALAARLVGQLPREDGRGVLVAADNSIDIAAVLSLCFGISVPALLGPAKSRYVGRHPAVIAPVIDEVDDQLDTSLLRRRHDVVEPLQPISAGVDLRA